MNDKAAGLEDRLVDFAVRVINVVEALPDCKLESTLPDSWFDRALRPLRITAKLKVPSLEMTSFTR